MGNFCPLGTDYSYSLMAIYYYIYFSSDFGSGRKELNLSLGLSVNWIYSLDLLRLSRLSVKLRELAMVSGGWATVGGNGCRIGCSMREVAFGLSCSPDCGSFLKNLSTMLCRAFFSACFSRIPWMSDLPLSMDWLGVVYSIMCKSLSLRIPLRFSETCDKLYS
jgi:hypothetical protein